MQAGFTAVLLAAGVGSRLGALTATRPKPLTLVNGKPLIAYTIAWVKALGAGNIIVVGGYLFEMLEAAVHEIDPQIVMARNYEYATTHRMVSLLAAADKVEGDLVVQDADYLYHRNVTVLLAHYNYQHLAVHASKGQSRYTAQDVVVEVDKNSHLVNMYKTAGTKVPLAPNEWYFNSLVYCPARYVGGFFDEARHALQTLGNGQLHVEDVVVSYAKHRGAVEVVDAGAPLWVEVDNQDELAAAERFIKEYPGDIAV